MSDRGRGLKITTSVADNLAVVVVIVLAVGAVGGYLTYTTHVDPGTQLETREMSSWESTGEFTHSATVVNGTAAFDEGETLRNRTTYFTRTTPRLNGSFAYHYTASSGGELETNTTLSLVLRSAEADDGDEPTKTYWLIDRQLNRDGAASLSPAERIRTPFSLNVSAVAEEVQHVDDQLGGTPGQLHIDIVANVSITGMRNGNPVETSRTYRLPIEPDGGIYRVIDPGTVHAEDTETTQVAVPVTYGPLWRAGGPMLVILSLAGLVGLGYANQTGALFVSDRERSWIAFRSDRAEFDEWISTGTVAAGDSEPATVVLDSLSGLVDIAIDTNSRVIEDTRTGAFYVFADDERFRFDPPSEPDRVRRDQVTPLDRVASDDHGKSGGSVASESEDEPDEELTSESGRESDEEGASDENVVPDPK